MRWIVRNFQILIVSAVKMCKQCLQAASASGGLRSPAAYRRFATGAPGSLGYSPKWKFLAPPLPVGLYSKWLYERGVVNCYILSVRSVGYVRLCVSQVYVANRSTNGETYCGRADRTVDLSAELWINIELKFTRYRHPVLAPRAALWR